MADNNAMNLKVILRGENGIDIRRFTVDAQMATSNIFMREKLVVLFPILLKYTFKITWKDSDDDEVTIATDNDFIVAFTEMSANLKVLYVTVLEQFSDPIPTEGAEGSSAVPYPAVICDVCEQSITGLRYKCIQCPDYDLCSSCSHKGFHNEHVMLRVPNTMTEMPKYVRKFMHGFSHDLKRTASAAQKGMHRAATKHCGRSHVNGINYTNATDKGKAKGDQRANNGNSSQNETDSSGSKGGYPFTGDAFSVNDFRALNSISEEQLCQWILDAFKSTEIQQQGGELITDLIRNFILGFFGQGAASSNQDSQAKTTEDAKSNAKNASTTDEADTPTQAQKAEVQAELVAMEMEGNWEAKDATSEKLQKATTSKSNDHGWIFIPRSLRFPQPQPQPQPQRQLLVITPHQRLQLLTQEQLNQEPAATCFRPNLIIADGLMQLHDMGFQNQGDLLTMLLERYGGNVGEVVKCLVEMKY